MAGRIWLCPIRSASTTRSSAAACLRRRRIFLPNARDGFDMLYREGASQPKMMSVGLHMRITGHPSRAVGLERFLDHVMAHQDVWICRREEIARHWMAHHPYAP